MKKKIFFIPLLFLISLFIINTNPNSSFAAKIGNITSIYGAMSNPMVGYGLVVGLNGTGDRWGVNVTRQSIVTMLSKLGVNTDQASLYEIRDTAAVMVTAELPPFAVPGERISVTVSSIGNAESLQGGVLLMTPLKGSNGKVYTLAQGSVSTGGNVTAQNVMPLPGYIPVSQNFQTSGIVDNGGIVEKGIPIRLNSFNTVRLILKNPNFTNASMMASAINIKFGNGTAKSLNSTEVSINVPASYKGNVAEFISKVNGINVKTHLRAIIVIDERSGTVVMGGNIEINPVAISNKNITLKIGKKRVPNAFFLKRGLTVQQLIKALNAVGASTSSIISILESIKAAGALSAQIKII
ncbi:MAG TPA: flagellar basal body P-ring protein FlgI [bacterium]|nr:flagellar basal body P-ring protein FlgI [bacterium]